jgi:hypothetical protein
MPFANGNLLATIVLCGWTLVVFYLFSSLPPRRAVSISLLLGWLFLPVASFDLQQGDRDVFKRVFGSGPFG